MVLRLEDRLTLKNASRNGEASLKNQNCFEYGTFGDRTLAYSGVKVQIRFYAGDLVTRTGDREIRFVSGRVGMYGIHVDVEIFSCIFLLYTPLLTLSKHKGENVHNKPQQMKVTYCRARKTKLYSV